MIEIDKLVKGAVVLVKHNRERVVDHVDGMYIYFEDGTKYSHKHPDIVKIVSIPAKKKSSKKKQEEPVEEDNE